MGRDPYYEADNLFLPDPLIDDLAARERTPFYLYDAQGIRDTSGKIFEAFSWNPGFRQYFPVKAANVPGVLKLMLESGQGLLCTSGLELELARRTGACTQQILFAPICPTEQDLMRAAEEDIPTVIDSEQMAKDLLKLEKLPTQLGLRYHPEKNVEVGARIVVRTEGRKFGMDTLELVKVARLLKARGVCAVGLHCHLKGGVDNARYWGKLLQLLHVAAQRIREKAKVEIAYYNLGGGLISPSCTDTRPLQIETVAEYVHTCAQQLDLALVPVQTEFGRYAVGPHGILISGVRLIKPFYEEIRPLVILDAGINKIMRHVGNHMQFHVSVVGRRETAGRRFYSLAGPLSDHLDKMANKYMLPELHPGDLVALHGAGAYCASLDANYASTLKSAVYLYEDGILRCLRRSETEEDYFSHMVF
ncbi:MAG: hypothetical protein E7449_01495 [Ruminococcaceae bacterium]|nr:hypothetical protein [Oscillospiraceae bacterium]